MKFGTPIVEIIQRLLTFFVQIYLKAFFSTLFCTILFIKMADCIKLK
jgi:hypothetical protein